jgi:hypothetical protein
LNVLYYVALISAGEVALTSVGASGFVADSFFTGIFAKILESSTCFDV